MNKDKLGQEPAFVYGHVSKRLWVATMALSGLCANGDISKALSEAGMKPVDVRESLVASAIKMSDLLLKQERANNE